MATSSEEWQYLRSGLYPFLLEKGSSLEQFSAIKEKIIHDDIPNYDRSITMEDVANIEKTLSFLGKSPIDGINYSSREWSTTENSYSSIREVRTINRESLPDYQAGERVPLHILGFPAV